MSNIDYVNILRTYWLWTDANKKLTKDRPDLLWEMADLSVTTLEKDQQQQ
jgi:hypothetical protein